VRRGLGRGLRRPLTVAAAKVRLAVRRMEQSKLSNVEWFRGIGEYKIDWGPGLRINVAKDGLKIIILIGGGTNKRQQQDIDQAVALCSVGRCCVCGIWHQG